MSIYTLRERKWQAWLKIARLPFYPMSFIAYSLGAAAAYATFRLFDSRIYIVGYLILFFIEFATVLTNELFDLEGDRLNSNGGTYTGGTRILVEGKLGFGEVRVAIAVSLFLLALAAALLVRVDHWNSPLALWLLVLVGVFLGLGYTAPPVRLSYRGLGELTVGLTHSPYTILCGYVFQSGTWNVPLPWLLCIPLFFAVLAANTLAGIPDRLSDEQVSKKSLAVLFGPRTAVVLTACFVVASWVSWAGLGYGRTIHPVGLATVPIFVHGSFLLWALYRLIHAGEFDRRIDPLMALALSYIPWFGILPLLILLWG